MKKFIIGLLVASTMMSCGGDNGEDSVTPTNPKDDITITAQLVNSSFVGNGPQWGGYDVLQAWTGSPTLSTADWNTLFERIRFMRPPFVRIMISDGWNYIDNGNYNPEKSQHVLFKILDFCQAEGISVLFGEWGHQGGSSAIAPNFVENSSNFLDYLVNTKGYSCIKYFNMVNEPNGDWSSIKNNYALWKDLVAQYYAKLEEKGIAPKVKMIGPDIAIWDANHTSWVMNTRLDLGSKMGAYDIHTYPNETVVREGSYGKSIIRPYKSAAEPNKPMIMGELGFKYSPTSELGKENAKRIAADKYASDDSQMHVYDGFYAIDMADAVIQNMMEGYAGVILWSFDDAQYNIDGGGSTKLKRWGFWNILGAEKFENPNDENIRPWFYTMSLLCRYFPAGTQIYSVELPNKKGVRAIAGVKDGKTTVAIVNSHLVSYTVNLKMANGSIIEKAKTYKYVSGKGSTYTATTDAKGFATPISTNESIDLTNGKAKVIELPAQSFVLITNMN